MADNRLKNLRGPARRNFLRWIGAAGAAVALEQSKLLNWLSDEGGVALADDSCAANRSVHIVGGNGSFAWFQLLWPHFEVGTANNAAFAFHEPSANGVTVQAQGGNGPFHFASQAPWMQGGAPTRPVTAFMAGKDETHTDTPDSAARVAGNVSMLATAAAIQNAIPAVVPVIGVDPLKFGNATGAPAIATVPSAQGMIELFNSVSSNLTLAAQEDKALFETYYKAFLGVRYAAGSPSWQPHLDITKKAAHLIGFNFSQQLTPAAADLTNYGLTALAGSVATTSQKQKMDSFGRSMITAAKALKLGLTNCVVIGVSPGPTSDTMFTDPHQIFANAGNTAAAIATLTAFGAILNGFYNDLATVMDPTCSSKSLDQTVILTAHGDTPHNPLIASGWPDATPSAANWLYVMGNGYLKSGWFGGIRANGQVDGFDPATGQTMPNQSSVQTAPAAGAAVAYAVAKGNMNTVSQFYAGGPITGIINTA